MPVVVRLTPEELRGILATGSSACARSATIEAPASELLDNAAKLLARGAGRLHRVDGEGMVLDRSGPVVRDKILVRVSQFGPKATVSLHGTRALRLWVILVGWFVVPSLLGFGAAAAVVVLVRHPPSIAPGLAFVAALIATLLGLRGLANALADRWARTTHAWLLEIERDLTAQRASGSAYRA